MRGGQPAAKQGDSATFLATFISMILCPSVMDFSDSINGRAVPTHAKFAQVLSQRKLTDA